MSKQAKRIAAWTGDRNAAHTIDQAVKLVKENAKAKFDESIEIAINLGSRRGLPALGHRPRRSRRRHRQGRQGR